MYSPPLKFEKFRISKELGLLLKQWKQEIEDAPNLSKSLIKNIYSQAAQRIEKVQSEMIHQDDSSSLEAIVISTFLTKIPGIPEINNKWLMEDINHI